MKTTMSKSVKKTLALVTTLALVAAMLCSCGTKITGIDLTGPQTLDRGDTVALQINYQYDKDAPGADEAAKLAAELGLAYTSSDESVVTVDESGNLTAVGRGTADVTATDAEGAITDTVSIEVTVTPQSIEMPSELTFTMTAPNYKFVPAIQPEDADEMAVTWASSDEDVATIDADGAMVGLAEGTTTITATIAEAGLSASCEVTFAPKITSFTLSNIEIDMKPGDTASLDAITEPVDVSQEAVIWESTDPDVATIDDKGNITAVDNGYSYIFAHISGVQISCHIVVDETGEHYENGVARFHNSSVGYFDITQPNGAEYVFTDAEYGLYPYKDYEFAYDISDPRVVNPEAVWQNHLKYAFATFYGTNEDKDIAYAMAEGVNEIRARHGLPALKLDESLSKIAYDRAEYCAENGLDGHRGAKTNGEILGEDPYMCANAMLNGWYRSTGHREVILYPQFTRMGTAITYKRQGEAGTMREVAVVVFM